MNFDEMVVRLQSLYDVEQPRATSVVNERLQQMLAEAKSLRALVTVGTTVADQAAYALAANIVQVHRLDVAFTSGTVTYTGTESLDTLQDLQAGRAAAFGEDANFYTVQPDTDGSQVTNNLYLWPAPTEAGRTMTGNCSLIPTAITYGSSTALPIPLDLHRRLLAGCKAELSDEEGRQDEAQKFEAVYEIGVQKLKSRAASLAQGSDRHRMRMVGYDLNR